MPRVKEDGKTLSNRWAREDRPDKKLAERDETGEAKNRDKGETKAAFVMGQQVVESSAVKETEGVETTIFTMKQG